MGNRLATQKHLQKTWERLVEPGKCGQMSRKERSVGAGASEIARLIRYLQPEPVPADGPADRTPAASAAWPELEQLIQQIGRMQAALPACSDESIVDELLDLLERPAVELLPLDALEEQAAPASPADSARDETEVITLDSSMSEECVEEGCCEDELTAYDARHELIVGEPEDFVESDDDRDSVGELGDMLLELSAVAERWSQSAAANGGCMCPPQNGPTCNGSGCHSPVGTGSQLITLASDEDPKRSPARKLIPASLRGQKRSYFQSQRQSSPAPCKLVALRGRAVETRHLEERRTDDRFDTGAEHIGEHVGEVTGLELVPFFPKASPVHAVDEGLATCRWPPLKPIDMETEEENSAHSEDLERTMQDELEALLGDQPPDTGPCEAEQSQFQLMLRPAELLGKLPSEQLLLDEQKLSYVSDALRQHVDFMPLCRLVLESKSHGEPRAQPTPAKPATAGPVAIRGASAPDASRVVKRWGSQWTHLPFRLPNRVRAQLLRYGAGCEGRNSIRPSYGQTSGHAAERLRLWLLSAVSSQFFKRSRFQSGVYFCVLNEVDDKQCIMGLVVLEEFVHRKVQRIGELGIRYVVLYGSVSFQFGRCNSANQYPGSVVLVPPRTNYCIQNQGDELSILYYLITS